MLRRSPIIQAAQVWCSGMGAGVQGQEPGAHHHLCHRCGHQCCYVWVPGTGVSAPRRRWSCTECCGPAGCQPGECSVELGLSGHGTLQRWLSISCPAGCCGTLRVAMH